MQCIELLYLRVFKKIHFILFWRNIIGVTKVFPKEMISCWQGWGHEFMNDHKGFDRKSRKMESLDLSMKGLTNLL